MKYRNFFGTEILILFKSNKIIYTLPTYPESPNIVRWNRTTFENAVESGNWVLIND